MCEKFDLPARTLRFYTAKGLLAPTRRGRERLYGPLDQLHLAFILKGRRLGFTLDEIPHAAIANPDDEPIRHLAVREEQGMRSGGFGVLLAQKLVDELIYGQYGNEVLLVKYLDSAKPIDSPP